MSSHLLESQANLGQDFAKECPTDRERVMGESVELGHLHKAVKSS